MFQSSRFEVFPGVFFAYVEYLDGYEDRQKANITLDLHYFFIDFQVNAATDCYLYHRVLYTTVKSIWKEENYPILNLIIYI